MPVSYLIDTHCHLQNGCLIGNVKEIIQRAQTAGVGKVVCCGVAERDWPAVLDLARTYPDFIIPSFGLHPWYMQGRSGQWLEKLESYLMKVPSGMGEIGLDHALDNYDPLEQHEVFRLQLELAGKLQRPVSIHCRRAWETLLDMLGKQGIIIGGGAVHSYSGAMEILSGLFKYNISVSFSGSITRSHNKRGRKALAAMPLDRLLVETDSPDLVPMGKEKPNEPGNLPIIVDTISQLRGMSREEIISITTTNALKIYNAMCPHPGPLPGGRGRTGKTYF